MGIDGIGGGGLPPGGVGGPGGPSGPKGPASTDFESGVEGAAPVGGASASAPLQQLQAGEISIDQYLDTRVDSAVAHLEGKLPADQLDFVRQTLRQELETDPVLVELVRRATGVASSSSADR